ncbi:MAG TPA: NAD(P)/FAD-dependent oxidoreductase [Candidatus Dormibacteraeota bacterium]|jgi:menaquinone-9 beta-reductase|nr:NAD(P)/FAD-dependent oxidoreductase [Candidatus Dormibacteraeota bacterium]
MLWLKMPARDYDAIVVGASFAGLAVARELRGKVLLLDRNEVGAVQTSACGTPLWVPEALGVAASVLQVHDRLVIRTPTRTVRYDLSAVPFCTFDYRAFCEGLLAQCRVRFLRTSVSGIQDGAVVTGEGRFTAPVIVDCSGWRRALTGGEAGEPARHHSFGLETRTSLRDEGLTFLLDRRLIPQGLGWIFPVGSGSLIGLGSYAGRSKLKPALERLLRDQGTAAGSYHGTYFPNRLLRPTTGGVFAVGDAAGQCLPLTAEGIRPALYFGGECGRIVQRVLDGALTLEAGLDIYRRVVARYRRPYRMLQFGQWMAAHTPTRWFAVVTEIAATQPFLPRWWPRYGWFGHPGLGVPAAT